MVAQHNQFSANFLLNLFLQHCNAILSYFFSDNFHFSCGMSEGKDALSHTRFDYLKCSFLPDHVLTYSQVPNNCLPSHLVFRIFLHLGQFYSNHSFFIYFSIPIVRINFVKFMQMEKFSTLIPTPYHQHLPLLLIFIKIATHPYYSSPLLFGTFRSKL